MRLVKIEKWGETKMIRRFEVALYQSRESRERKGSGFTEEPKRRSCVCLLLSHLRLSLTLPRRTFQVIKGKEKKQIIFLYISVVIFFYYTIHSYTHTYREPNVMCKFTNTNIYTDYLTFNTWRKWEKEKNNNPR